MDYRNRKAAAAVRFTDTAGQPLRNTLLHYEQTGHDFLFGCGAFDFLPFTNEQAGD